MTIRYLFFDLDHTLWDYDRNADETLEHLYVHYRLAELVKGDAEEFKTLYHEVNRRMWREYDRGLISKEFLRHHRFEETLVRMGAPREEIPHDMWEMFLEICPTKTHLMEGALETLQNFAGVAEMGVITNGFERTQHIKMKSSGIAQYFNHVITSEALGIPKPNPEIFHEMMRRFGAKPEECVMIGDNEENDIIGAANAGIPGVHYHPSEHVGSPHARWRIQHLRELEKVLPVVRSFS